MSTQRSQFTITVTVETEVNTPEQHRKLSRYVYRNMLATNADLRDAFFVAAVRDEDGRLLEFQGAGRGQPSAEIQEVLESYLDEEGQ